MEAHTIIAIVLSSLGTGTMVSGLFIWLVKSSFGNVVKLAVVTERQDRMEDDLAEAKKKATEIETNYNAKFKDVHEHITAENEKTIAEVRKIGESVTKINSRCFAFHPELVE